MANSKTAKGLKLVLRVGDGATPVETFTPICTITSQRGVTFTSSANEEPIIDCDDPEKIAWIARTLQDMSAAFTGSGTLNTPDIARLWALKTAEDSFNAQVIVDVPSADGGVIWSGAWVMPSLEFTGERGARMTCNISLSSDGEIAMADNT